MGKWDEAIEAGSGDMWDQTGVIEGVYIARRENVGPNNSNVYLIRTEEGDKGVWGSTVLDGKFDDIPLNCEVQVEFTGMSEKAGKFGKHYKEFRVRFIPSQVATAEKIATHADPEEGERIAIDKEIKSASAKDADNDTEGLGLDGDY